MKSKINLKSHNRLENWIALIMCLAVLVSRFLEQSIHKQLDSSIITASVWIPLIVTVFVATGFIEMNEKPIWSRLRQILQWSSLLLIIWVANGLPFDILRMTGLIPIPVDWPGFATKVLAFAIAVILMRQTLSIPTTIKQWHVTKLYGYAAFILALPYPILRTFWAFGGTLGLMRPGAAGTGFLPWLASIPWLFAIILSLLLVLKRFLLPRRLLIVAGWSATAIVALIGPAASWELFSKLFKGEEMNLNGIATWVPCLIYVSWLLWALATGFATRSFQLRNTDSDETLKTKINYDKY